MMYGHEKSRSAIVAGKPTNKAERSAAELVERRAETKGNAGQQRTRRAQYWISMSKLLARIRQHIVAVDTQGGNRMRASCTYGSVRGARGNSRPYRDRREFITLLGGAAAWPITARAQQAGKVPTIGFMGTDASSWSPYTAAFSQRLRELGWIDDRTIAIVYRWAEGRSERYAEIAAEFVRLKVNVIVTSGIAVAMVKQATSVIPVVFAISDDPVGGGLVASLARPGGNVTGLSVQSTDLTGKRLELLREVVPRLHRLALIGNVGYLQAVVEMGEVQAKARTLGLEFAPLEIRRAEDIAPAFDALKTQADALYVVGDALIK